MCFLNLMSQAETLVWADTHSPAPCLQPAPHLCPSSTRKVAVLHASPSLIQVSPQRNPGKIKEKALFYTPKHKYAEDQTLTPALDTTGTQPKEGTARSGRMCPLLQRLNLNTDKHCELRIQSLKNMKHRQQKELGKSINISIAKVLQ